ncbi:hypothetical protein ABH930_004803 [Kitasatospora sp. GAS204A]|uniref:DUF397 domain-containing protein n=1 Tax=unclassified Kitasatospora TaxID=2633591 RepID=UPI00247586BD|nr:DUF397 domain-containing protein [Kitasatospora sp. GAS204B]MDH6120707.1 hypothetical protein [Kitasatospora sp. GAS204B]
MNIDLTNARWVKSRHSGNGGQCVEVAPDFPGIVPVRDSKDPHGPALVFTTDAWQAFARSTAAGDLGAV